MKSLVAIIGRPNVGKSTLFNRFTRSRDALVANIVGLTRDRQYGTVQHGEHQFIAVDTGGLSGEETELSDAMALQTQFAVDEADLVVFLCDAHGGITGSDAGIAEKLRRAGKQVLLVVNKIDGADSRLATSEFHVLGLGEPIGIAAVQGRGTTFLLDKICESLLKSSHDLVTDDKEVNGIKVAVVGRPNAGKSTLINRLLKEERVLASDIPGTTRDSVYIPFSFEDKDYTLIDTAGLRRKARVKETAEKFSAIQTLKAIDDSNVVILLLDAQQSVADQDLTILSQVIESGRALMIAVNKWDHLSQILKDQVKRDLDRRLDFVPYADLHFISALHGKGIGKLMKSVSKAYASARQSLSTPQLTRILELAIQDHQPPLVRGRRVKLRYAHQGGVNPPIIVIHGNQTKDLAESYKRYLENYFRKALDFAGTPVRLVFKTGENPYAGKRNKLTPSQQNKRKRMFKHVKKKS